MIEPNFEKAKSFADRAAELAIEMSDQYTSYKRLCEVNGRTLKTHTEYFLEVADQETLHQIRGLMCAYAVEMGYITENRFK